MQWIKVTDKQPRLYTPVLCTLENPETTRYPLVCFLNDEGEWLDMRCCRIDKNGACVRYWMTIPDVPSD